jgi:hypothetical protein
MGNLICGRKKPKLKGGGGEEPVHTTARKPCSSYIFQFSLIWIVKESCAGILEQSMEARNKERIGLLYRPARLHRLAESTPWNRFLGSLKVYKYQLWENLC